MNAFRRSVIAGCFVLLPVLAQAGVPAARTSRGGVEARQLKLVFSGGNVSIDADAVRLREILEAWATLGGTRIDGIDRLPEIEITLHVEVIAEDEALAELLKGRNAFATVHRKPGEAGASRVARIALFSTAPGSGGAKRRTVPADWPFPVNEHPDDEDRQPPTTEIKIERPGIEIPWPLPIDETVAVDTPATGVLERPGIDVPWPFPVNEQPTLELDAPAAAAPSAIPGIDMPWPFPVNPNPVDPDAPASGAPDAPATNSEPAAAAPRDPAAADPAAAETPSPEAKKPATQTEEPASPKPRAKAGAPVSTKAPKPIPPRKRPQPQRER